MVLLQAALQISDSPSPGESPFSTASQTVQMPDEEEERTQHTDKEVVSEVKLALALALVQSMPWHAPSLDRPSAFNGSEADTEASAPPMSSQQAQALLRAQLADDASARVAGINPTTNDTPQDEYDFWNPPQYRPAESSQADLQLSPWETATVVDSGLQPHPGRAHLDTGKYHDELAGILFDGHQAASSSPACVACHLGTCASDSSAEPSALLLHGTEQCCHLLHWHVMSQRYHIYKTLLLHRFSCKLIFVCVVSL